MGGMTGIDR